MSGIRAVQNLRRTWKRLTRTALRRPYPSFEEYQLAEKDFYGSFVKAGMVVFDVGANIGEMTRLFLTLVGPAGAVHAFEPGSFAFQRLLAIRDEFPGYIIKLNHAAASDRKGEVVLNIYDADHCSWNTLANRPPQTTGCTAVGVERIRALTLDEYCQEERVESIDLLKIDVEGAEYQVLLGASGLFRDRKVQRCIFEYGQTTWDMGNNPQQIQSFLQQFGYTPRNLIAGHPPFGRGGNAEDAAYTLVLGDNTESSLA